MSSVTLQKETVDNNITNRHRVVQTGRPRWEVNLVFLQQHYLLSEIVGGGHGSGSGVVVAAAAAAVVDDLASRRHCTIFALHNPS